MHHAGAGAVQRELAHGSREKLEPDPEPIRHLRAYSHYLAPQVGLLSADSWTLAATIARNLLLNWLVLLPLLAAAVLVLLTAALPAASGAGGDDRADAAWLSPGATVGVMLGSVVAGALIGGRGWAAPAVLLPVGCGWLALQAGLADHGDGGRSAVRGPHPNLQIAYISLVLAVLLPLLAWFAGVI
jgi:hypothetical protein